MRIYTESDARLCKRSLNLNLEYHNPVNKPKQSYLWFLATIISFMHPKEQE